MKRKTLLIFIATISILVLIGAWGWSTIRNHPFFSYLRAPSAPIEEVIIRGYGDVPSYLLKAAQEATEQKIGVRTRIDSPRPGFGKQMQYYNPDRGQYDGDKIWDSEQNFARSFHSKRLIMIVDGDVYTEIQPKRPYIFSRSSPNISVILISAYRLQKLSDSSDQPAPSDLASERIQKLTLQTLGVSVFLEGFSLEEQKDISCVMYRGRVLSELDKQGNDFCDKNKKKLKKYFVTSHLSTQSDDCRAIDGSNFQSIHQYEVGLGPNGPAMGYWRILLKNGNVQWGHSDISESGTYTCSNSVVEAKLLHRSITAHYDKNQNIFVWDGVEYKKSE